MVYLTVIKVTVSNIRFNANAAYFASYVVTYNIDVLFLLLFETACYELLASCRFGEV